MDKVLDSFCVKDIEDIVGSWIRNKTLNDSQVVSSTKVRAKSNKVTKAYKRKPAKKVCSPIQEQDSKSEYSDDSVEELRYLKSIPKSKPHCSSEIIVREYVLKAQEFYQIVQDGKPSEIFNVVSKVKSRLDNESCHTPKNYIRNSKIQSEKVAKRTTSIRQKRRSLIVEISSDSENEQISFNPERIKNSTRKQNLALTKSVIDITFNPKDIINSTTKVRKSSLSSSTTNNTVSNFPKQSNIRRSVSLNSVNVGKTLSEAASSMMKKQNSETLLTTSSSKGKHSSSASKESSSSSRQVERRSYSSSSKKAKEMSSTKSQSNSSSSKEGKELSSSTIKQEKELFSPKGRTKRHSNSSSSSSKEGKELSSSTTKQEKELSSSSSKGKKYSSATNQEKELSFAKRRSNSSNEEARLSFITKEHFSSSSYKQKERSSTKRHSNSSSSSKEELSSCTSHHNCSFFSKEKELSSSTKHEKELSSPKERSNSSSSSKSKKLSSATKQQKELSSNKTLSHSLSCSKQRTEKKPSIRQSQESNIDLNSNTTILSPQTRTVMNNVINTAKKELHKSEKLPPYLGKLETVMRGSGLKKVIVIYSPKDKGKFLNCIKDGKVELNAELIKKSIGDNFFQKLMKSYLHETPYRKIFSENTTLAYFLPTADTDHNNDVSSDEDEDDPLTYNETYGYIDVLD